MVIVMIMILPDSVVYFLYIHTTSDNIVLITLENKQQVQSAEPIDDEAKSDYMSTSVIGGSDRTEVCFV